MPLTDTKPATALTSEEAQFIVAAREIMRQAEDRIVRQSFGSSSADYNRDVGRMAEALSTARELLFNVVNVGSAYLDCPSCKQALSYLRFPDTMPAGDAGDSPGGDAAF